jgi:hypothetical protein
MMGGWEGAMLGLKNVDFFLVGFWGAVVTGSVV